LGVGVISSHELVAAMLHAHIVRANRDVLTPERVVAAKGGRGRLIREEEL
jgi:hypothetical protein